MSFSLRACSTLAHASFPRSQEISVRESSVTICCNRDLKNAYTFMTKPYGIYG